MYLELGNLRMILSDAIMWPMPNPLSLERAAIVKVSHCHETKT